ncbi:hypothetical protein A2U01_0105431, partial [Trifolium medium]|nr:hypothetical protein [Trifolium medium]
MESVTRMFAVAAAVVTVVSVVIGGGDGKVSISWSS